MKRGDSKVKKKREKETARRHKTVPPLYGVVAKWIQLQHGNICLRIPGSIVYNNNNKKKIKKIKKQVADQKRPVSALFNRKELNREKQ